MTGEPVEIIVPVYNAADDLARCLESLAGRIPDAAGVQIVDDASTDPAISRVLRVHPLGRRGRTRTFRNLSNLGFVRSVNAAIARARGDVVLLNSDTVVTDGWLDRMTDCALSDPMIATITPFSNNAEICSLPMFCQSNPLPPDPDAVARAAVAAGPPVYPDLPTGVGFCMFIRRAAWESVGPFDAATFGRGYGEENDWCLRASAQGWRHVLCDDAYVVHVGGQSFADTPQRPGGGQLEKLLAIHPHYNELIAEFIRRDPLAPRRAAIISQLRGSAFFPDDHPI